MQNILVVRIDFQCLVVQINRFIKLVVAKRLNGLLENLFLCHDESIAIEFRAIMENITTSNVKFPAGATEASGFLAIPSAEGSRPGLLVLQEWWGMNDHIKDITKRLAN